MCGLLCGERSLLRCAEDGEPGMGEVGGKAREGRAEVKEVQGAQGLESS